MKLTAQQEKFCQCIADGMSQADAYRTAYPKSAKRKPEALYVAASELMGKVGVRVGELKAALADKALWTREQAVQALIDEARGDRASDRISALKALNDMHGYNAPAKIDIRGSVSVAVSFD